MYPVLILPSTYMYVVMYVMYLYECVFCVLVRYIWNIIGCQEREYLLIDKQ